MVWASMANGNWPALCFGKSFVGRHTWNEANPGQSQSRREMIMSSIGRIKTTLTAVAVGTICSCLVAARAHAEATFTLGQAIAAPGESDVSVPISVDIPADSPRVSGWSIQVSYNEEALGNVRIMFLKRPDYSHFAQQNTFEDAGRVGAAAVYNFTGLTPESELGPEDSGPVAELHFCVLADAPAGTHALSFESLGARREGTGQPILLAYSADARTHTPEVISGSVTVSGDPVEGSCSPDDRTPPGTDNEPPFPIPDKLDGTFALASGEGFPGETVSLPFSVSANAETRGVSFSLDFDETVLEGVQVEELTSFHDGSDSDFKIFNIDNADATPGNGGVDEGYIAGAWVFSLTDHTVFLPPDEEHVLLAFQFRIREGASTGETELGFIDGGKVSEKGQPVVNIMTVTNQSVEPVIETSMVLIGGNLKVLIDVITFLRGDSNGDLLVDISDVMHTLRFLFLGGKRPHCYDAADANDDGELDISDAIDTLSNLFLTGDAFPPPNSSIGLDPTPDYLGCRVRHLTPR